LFDGLLGNRLIPPQCVALTVSQLMLKHFAVRLALQAPQVQVVKAVLERCEMKALTEIVRHLLSDIKENQEARVFEAYHLVAVGRQSGPAAMLAQQLECESP
jgi:hypothetical protein